MKINSAGLSLIRRFEGCELKAYYDEHGGVWTIGYGHTHGVKRGQTITKEDADAFLSRDVSWAEEAVMECVKAQINTNQFSACVSLCFNIGADAFKRSTLVKKINAEDFDGAADEFQKWNKAGGKVLNGLIRRRAAEEELFRRDPPKPLAKSRTIKAAQVGAVGTTAIGAISETVDQLQPTISVVQTLHEYWPVMAITVLVVSLAAVVWFRIDDHLKATR